MGNFISFIQEIFMMKEDNSAKVGLSAFKNPCRSLLFDFSSNIW